MELDVKDGKVDLSAVLKGMKEEHGGADKVALKLLSDNHGYRQKLKLAKDELADLKKKVPADGARVLTAEENKAFEAYQALGKAEDLKAALEAAKTAQVKLASIERRDLVGKAAGAHGLDAEAVASLLPADLALEIVQEQGEEGKVSVARVKDGAKTPTLPEWLAERHPALAPRLKVESGNEAKGPAAAPVVPYPSQSGTSKAQNKAKDLVQQAKDRNKALAEAPNALRPRAAAQANTQGA